ncbi:MAG: hypothetical protein DLM61_05225 [Pseudonocardiales bacterium]|nr:MAG: hypothetical protein DLM61_05225 [Pseudonocardiales bacterium]
MADMLIEELSGFGLVVSHDAARDVLGDRVQAVADTMRISQTTARSYFDADAIRKMAQMMALTLAEEQPGADLMGADRTVPVSMPLLGLCVAALSECINVRASNEPPEAALTNIGPIVGALSLLGQFIYSANAADWELAQVRVPPAFVYRAARYLEGAAEVVSTATHPDGTDAALAESLAARFRRDAEMLRDAASS